MKASATSIGFLSSAGQTTVCVPDGKAVQVSMGGAQPPHMTLPYPLPRELRSRVQPMA